MKNTKFRFTIFAVVILFAATLITSCGNTDVSDGDEKGVFSLTINGTKYDGTEVFNGAAIGIRTISAENSDMEIGILLNEEDYKAGATFDLSGASMGYLKVNNITSLPKSGTIKVISISRIEIVDGVFTEGQSGDDVTISGYISSK